MDSDDSGLHTPPRIAYSERSDLNVCDHCDANSTGMSTTPSMKELPRKITKEARRRVDEVDSEGRCLIENVSPLRGVKYVHCFPRKFSKNEKVLTRLEYYWGMKYRSLHLDTRYNIFRVGSSLRNLYHRLFWMLMPEESVVNQFHTLLGKYKGERYATRGAFPELKEKKYNYCFVSISDYMRQFTIARQNDVMTSRLPSNVTIHLYPFRTLPLLDCHLHPKFAIVEAGRRMQKYRKLALTSRDYRMIVEAVIAQWPAITKIEDVYEAWMRPLPEDALDNHMFDPPEYVHDVEKIGNDNSLRAGPQESGKRHGEAEPESHETGIGRKRKRDN